MNDAGKSRLRSGGDARGVERLHPAMRSRMWKPGQSGNPTGYSGTYGEVARLARQAAPYAVQRLIQLMDSDDERVATVACNSVLDRAFGRPKPVMEEKDDLETRIAKMTRAERLSRMRELLAPMRQYLHKLDSEQADAGVTTTESGGRPGRCRPSAA